MLYTTNYHKFYKEERDSLFDTIRYTQNNLYKIHHNIYKIGTRCECALLEKYSTNRLLFSHLKDVNEKLFYHATPIFWTKAFYDLKLFYSNGLNISDAYKSVNVPSDLKSLVFLIICSSFFFYLWTLTSDCYNLTKKDIVSIKIPFQDNLSNEMEIIVKKCSASLKESIEKNFAIAKYNYKGKGEVKFAQFFPGKYKNTLDTVDTQLAIMFQLNQHELDFIINHYFKYRIGQDNEQ